MTIDEAIQHCREQVQEQAKKGCYSCAEEHQQLAEWLRELKAYKDARAEINQALNDDVRGEQNDYERGRKSGIFLCESIISVKLGESRSEKPNTCGDAVSREAVENLLWEEPTFTDALNVLTEVREKVRSLPSVTPQQRTGRWIGAEVLDKIRAEIDEQYDRVYPYDISCAEGLEMALGIIDKYRAESEEKE